MWCRMDMRHARTPGRSPGVTPPLGLNSGHLVEGVENANETAEDREAEDLGEQICRVDITWEVTYTFTLPGLHEITVYYNSNTLK